jgi:hypothetical protein
MGILLLMKNYLCPVSLLGSRMHTPDQGRCHSESFNKHFKLFKQGKTGDEMCIHPWDLQSKEEAMGWIHNGSQKTQTFMSRNLLTVMLLEVQGFTGDRVHAKHVNFRQPLLSPV